MRKLIASTLAGAMFAACSAQSDINVTPKPTVDETAAATAPAAIENDPAVAAWIIENFADSGDILYATGEADLNGDGQNEVLAYIGGPMLCGTGGCNLVVLQRTGQRLDRLGDISVAQLPVGVFETSTNGWRDLAVSVYGGGIDGGVARVPFGEDRYTSNPTVAPAQMTEEPFETVIPDVPLHRLP